MSSAERAALFALAPASPRGKEDLTSWIREKQILILYDLFSAVHLARAVGTSSNSICSWDCHVVFQGFQMAFELEAPHLTS